VENVQGVWVYPQGANFQNYPRVGNDSEQVCPNSTTTYEMRVLLRDGSTVFRQVTINVNVPPTPTHAPATDPLAGTRWEIVQFNNGAGGVTTLIAETHASANFGTGGQLSGSGGCNNYTTSYQVNGNNISIGQPGATAMLCAEPEGIMEQETQILAALQSASTFTLSGNRLELRTAGDAIALILQRAP
jgi:heat shock protein HslJ